MRVQIKGVYICLHKTSSQFKYTKYIHGQNQYTYYAFDLISSYQQKKIELN